MSCDGTPDPAVHQDINTYMSLWRDDPEVGVTAVLKQCDLSLKVSATVYQRVLVGCVRAGNQLYHL